MTRALGAAVLAAATLLGAAPAGAACQTVTVLNLDGAWLEACAGAGGAAVRCGREELGCDD